MALGVTPTVQQVGAATDVAVVGILFGSALATSDGMTAQTGHTPRLS